MENWPEQFHSRPRGLASKACPAAPFPGARGKTSGQIHVAASILHTEADDWLAQLKGRQQDAEAGLAEGMPVHNLEDGRIERERTFHNAFFGETESPRAQGIYYCAVRDGADRFKEKVSVLAEGADVLEYGCSIGALSVPMMHRCRSLTGIDISDVAIRKAADKAAAEGDGKARFLVMNAEHMTFEDNSFDLVFGSGIIHHLDVDRSFREVARVLRPKGQAVFWEPLGCNPIINLYRRSTPQARTPDEHPLQPGDMKLAKRYLADVHLEFYGLFTLASIPLRKTAAFAPAQRLCRFADRIALSLPGLRWTAWFALIHLKKSV